MQALARRAAAPVFVLALFSSAALIFVLQPLFARMVTPLLGGSPAVWNTSMAFFQAALLLGYLYAHLLQRIQDLRIQAVIHVLVLAGAWLVLPVHVTGALGPPSSDHPALWLVGVLALSVGAPFAAASATAPLLQAWYARTGRDDAHDPYYLYAASNLGSFVGLLAYPIVIEPMLGAQAQGEVWTSGYMLVAAMIVVCGAAATASNGELKAKPTERSAAPTWRTRLYWLAAAAVPSAMSLGVTQHISTDVASAPMLWVVPLALYLATFVIAFARGGEKIIGATMLIQPFALLFMIASYYAAGNWLGSMGGILTGFFFSALICHQALAQARPDADRLTEFYLYVSLGGVAGGAFAAFVAPVIFNNIYEFPLAMAAACLFRPRAGSDMPRLRDATVASAAFGVVVAIVLLRNVPSVETALIAGALGAAGMMVSAGWGDESRPMAYRYAFLIVGALHAALVIAIAFNVQAVFTRTVDGATARLIVQQPWGLLLMGTSLLALMFAVHGTLQPKRDKSILSDLGLGVAIPSLVILLMLTLLGQNLDVERIIIIAIGCCALAVVFNRGRPFVLAAVVLAAFAIIFLDDARGGRIITQERSFFGVLRTRVLQSSGAPPLRVLMHGTTIHGAQLVGPDYSRLPLTYYHPRTALGEAITGGLSTGESSRLALIGLGAGSTACLMGSADTLTIFEIDPAVVRLSTEPGGDFSYVPQCQPNARIVLGDARLRIAEERDNSYDVIVVDAFSSDAIPAHLLTREAIALYLSKLTDRGIVVLHLSNRNLALVSEAARVARDLGVPHLFRISDRFEQPPVSYYGGLAASVMILARTQQALDNVPLPSNDWTIFEAPPGRGWTDDYINLPRALWEGVASIEHCRLYPYLPECGSRDPLPPAPRPNVQPSP